jgi:hypothetical protein
MESIFDESECTHLIARIEKLTDTVAPHWGTMDVAQMLHHLNCSIEASLGKLQLKGKPFFLLKFFKSVLFNDIPFGKGIPTPKDFKVISSHNFRHEKEKLMENMNDMFNHGTNGKYPPHVMFGELTGEQWGKHTFKHIDHHLKQFGV